MNVRTVLPAFVLDVVLVTVFAGIGRGTHEREATVFGLFDTGWPFLLGLSISWLVTLAWRDPIAPVRTGLPIWVGTVLIGMLARALTDQGTALPFVLVATGSIGLLLVGWRALAALIRRRAER